VSTLLVFAEQGMGPGEVVESAGFAAVVGGGALVDDGP
jgi:hypothetical protein